MYKKHNGKYNHKKDRTQKDKRFNDSKIFACDFETSVYDGQTETEVWAAGFCAIDPDDYNYKGVVFTSIDEFFWYFLRIRTEDKFTLYFHNLKFDGSFIIDWLLRNGYHYYGNKVRRDRYLGFDTFISDMNQWYSIEFTLPTGIKNKYKRFVVRDSYKILPFSIDTLSKDFKLPYEKLIISYKGERHAYDPITPKEEEYLLHDIYILRDSLNIFFDAYDPDRQALLPTIGSYVINYYKGKMLNNNDWFKWFKNYNHEQILLKPLALEKHAGHDFGAITADEYVRKAYFGGWCYLNRPDRHFYNGVTYDVNSLYPAMMHSDSGNYYPIGEPHFVSDVETIKDFINPALDKIVPSETFPAYYFIRFHASFELKKGMLPCVQNSTQKNCLWNSKSSGTWLKSGDYDMTLSCTDFILFRKHYKITSIKYYDLVWYNARKGMFDRYIDHFKKIKETSKGATRTLAKLFLNNLYGKFATSPLGGMNKKALIDDKVCSVKVDQTKTPLYIPIGAAITSYARRYTITAAQNNYEHFIYADTDSIHLDTKEAKDIEIHDTKFGAWKLEEDWKEAYYLRAKTYIDIFDDDTIDIKCAGMTARCKMLYSKVLGRILRNAEYDRLIDITDKEQAFLDTPLTFDSFNVGLKVPGKLTAKTIRGGTVLKDTEYSINK